MQTQIQPSFQLPAAPQQAQAAAPQFAAGCSKSAVQFGNQATNLFAPSPAEGVGQKLDIQA